MLTLQQIHAEAERLLEGAPHGESLDVASAELVAFAVRMSVTSLDTAGAQPHALRALEAGLTPAQLHEALFLVSGLGVHTLFEGLRLVEQLAPHEEQARDTRQQSLWDEHVGNDRYWQGFEREVPGFLAALLHASPPGFKAFFEFCAVPWQSGQLPALTKELLAMAADATPTHRYLPGMRLHLCNARKLGAGAATVREVLAIAARAPMHPGVAGPG